MARSVLLFSLLIATAARSCSAIWPFTSTPAVEFEHEHVLKLTAETFEDHVINESDKFYFIKFFAPWCGHCKTLAPVWGQLAAENTDANVEFSQVDCQKYNKLCKKAAVRGFPEIKVFYRGQIGLAMTGGKDLEGMRQFVKDALPSIKERHDQSKQEEAEKAKKGDGTAEDKTEL